MPLEYHQPGLSFMYPDNWKIDEPEMLAKQDMVAVYSPGGAFWSVARHPLSTDPVALAQGVVDALKQEYEDLEVCEACESIADRELQGFDMDFFYLDLTNTARVRWLRSNRSVYIIFVQAEDREFGANRLVFEAITTSFLTRLEQGD